jgi:hypothetical protein
MFTYDTHDKRNYFNIEDGTVESAWVDGDDVPISGAVPAYDIANTRLKSSHWEWLSLYYHNRPYIF